MESMESPTSGSAASSVERRGSSEDRKETQQKPQQQKPEELMTLGKKKHGRSTRLRRGTEQEIMDENKRKWEYVAYELWKTPKEEESMGKEEESMGKNKEESMGKNKGMEEEDMRNNLCSWSDKSVEEMWGKINQGWDAYDGESMGVDKDDQTEAKDDEDEDGIKLAGPWTSIYEAHSLWAKELLHEVDNFSYCERWKNKPSLLTRL